MHGKAQQMSPDFFARVPAKEGLTHKISAVPKPLKCRVRTGSREPRSFAYLRFSHNSLWIAFRAQRRRGPAGPYSNGGFTQPQRPHFHRGAIAEFNDQQRRVERGFRNAGLDAGLWLNQYLRQQCAPIIVQPFSRLLSLISSGAYGVDSNLSHWQVRA